MNKTIEEIENDYWKEPEYNSHLVETCYALRKKNLMDFTVEDIRIMIGQNMSLQILIPFAIQKLKENILIDGDYYEGDLLHSVLSSDRSFWRMNPKLKNELILTFEENMAKIKTFETTEEIKTSILEAYKIFKED